MGSKNEKEEKGGVAIAAVSKISAPSGAADRLQAVLAISVKNTRKYDRTVVGLLVCDFLDMASLICLARTCKRGRLAAVCDELWKPLAIARWPELKLATKV